MTTYTLPFDRISQGKKRLSNARPVLRSIDFNGLPVSVEIEVGETKSGIDEDGIPWKKNFKVPYGEIPSSKALSDGDGVDIYLASSNQDAPVFVIHQLRKDGSFDEDKVVLGALNQAEAEKIYRDHGPEWGFGTIDAMSWSEFENGYLASNRKL